MNYQKIYDSIIEKARSEDRVKVKKDNANYVYYERHHIIPKCLGGGDEEENLVLLTAREHFICHKLLTYIFPNKRKIATAFHYMIFGKGHYNVSNRDYSYARELISLIPMSEETRKKIGEAIKKIKRKPVSDRTKELLRIINTGKTHTEETKKKMSSLRKGKEKSKLHKQRIGLSHIGIKPDKESLRKNSESNKNSKKYICEHCGLITNGGNYNRWHGDKCKIRSEGC
jgi:rubrerythrin